MKIHKITVLLTIVFLFFSATYAFALPTLLVDEVSKLKFTNYENIIDVNDTGYIDEGDIATGIAIITGIYNVDDTITAWTPSAGEEVTVHFQFTVTGSSGEPIPLNNTVPLGTSGGLTFGFQSGDFIRLYYDDTANWDPTQATLAGAIATATDGDLYFSTEYDDYFYGVNVTTTLNSTNFLWADMTTNDTGYTINPMSYFSTAGVAVPGLEFVSDYAFESKVLVSVDPDIMVFQFRSEDPLYLYATAIPEPSTLILLGVGLLGVTGLTRRKMRN